jgi:hypothetical protein
MENEKQKKILDSLVMNQTEINETNKQNEHSIIKQYNFYDKGIQIKNY